MSAMYDALLDVAAAHNLKVFESVDFESSAKGLCYNDKIALSSRLETSAEKRCVLAEEIAHCRYTTGDILDPSPIGNAKQEAKARKEAVLSLVTIDDLVEAVKESSNFYEVSERLGITREFLDEVAKTFLGIYGPWYREGDLLIGFDPIKVIYDNEFMTA